MKSPTSTILHSIQALKSKLRSDHLQLQGIRRDFAMGPTRPIIETDQRSQSPVLANFKSNSSLQKNARAKLLQVRKHHQLETKQLHQRYKRQKQELIKDYEQKIQEMTKIFENKLNEQVSYIAMLQEQVQQQKQKEQIQTQNPIYLPIYKQKQKEDKSISPMKKSQDIRLCSKVYQLNCTEMTFDNKINFKLFGNSERGSQCGRIVDCGAQKLEEETVKYERIVNKLLQENAVLLQSVQTLKMQNRKLKHDNLVKSKAEEQQQYSVKDHFKYETTKIQQQRSISQSRSSQYLSVMPLVHQVGQHSSYRPNLPPTQVNKTRLKFSKATDRAKTQTDRSYSSIGNQNIDLSNIQYRNANSIEKHDEEQKYQKSIVEEDEESILCEEMKLKTIKHFMKAISHRSTQCEQYVDTHVEARFVPQMPIKKGVGLRNALRRISIL